MSDYTTPVLPGTATTDYARYMRTDELLRLQRTPAQMVHRDELLFQVTHQVTELWLQLAVFEVGEAAGRIRAGRIAGADLLLERAGQVIDQVTAALGLLRHLAPQDFQLVRTALGHGSGTESPGWRAIDRASRQLGDAFSRRLIDEGLDLLAIYRGCPADPWYRVAEGLIGWDERLALWRAHHAKLANRVLGHDVVGTKGMPVDALAVGAGRELYPRLWSVRSELTRTGPMGREPRWSGDDS